MADRDRPAAYETHRVVLRFDDGVNMKLICPETGCAPATVCGECSRHIDDEEIKPCGACPRSDDTCWVKTWFDNCTYDELLVGELTVEIESQWHGDHMTAEIIGPAAEPSEAPR